jgi:beta-galactosidase
VLTRKVGRGSITYIGAVLDDDLTQAAAKWMVGDSGISAVLGTVPQSVEVCMRQGQGKRVFILINHSQQQQSVSLPRSMTAMSSAQSTHNVSLPAYGVEVLKDSASQ